MAREERNTTRAMGRKMPRQSITIRLPGDVYQGQWKQLHRFVQAHMVDGRPLSNSIMTRLGVWALMRLWTRAQREGSEAVEALGAEMARVAQRATNRKHGPENAAPQRVYA